MSEVMDGYIRVSRVHGREGDSYISPDVQREAIKRWAEYKDITIGEWLVDEDWSGGTHNRPALTRGIERALSSESAGIVAWKIDRFSRTTEHGLRDLRRLKDAGSRLAFVVEDIDTATVYGAMVYTILLAVSTAFLESVKAGWIEAKTRASKRGAKVGRTPLGYLRREDGTLEADPVTAPIVSETFRLAGAHGLGAAMAHLQEHVTERRWTTTTTRRLLAQRDYLGETTWDGITHPDTHGALVKLSIWAAAQTAPSSRARGADFPLSGILRCASCGSPMVGGRGGKGQRIYRCSASLTGWTGERCLTGCVVTADRVESYALRTARDLLDGFGATIELPEADENLAALQEAVEDAQGAVRAFYADTHARKALGPQYDATRDIYVRELDEARKAYQAAAERTARVVHNWTAEELDGDLQAVADFLADLVRVTVRPGRGLKIEDRVSFAPLDADNGAWVASA